MPNSNANGIVNPYGAGDIKLDSTPYTRYFLQQEARKMAKDEALDKYFMDMEKSVTPTGMRNQEVQPLIEMQKASQQYYLKNKAAIRNPALDGGKSRTEYFGMHSDKMGLVQSSKNEKAKEAAIAPLLKNPEVRSRIKEGFFQKVDEFQKPLTDPTRPVFGDLLSEAEFGAKRLNPQQQEALFKQYGNTAGEVFKKRTVVGVDPNDGLKDVVRYTKEYTPKQLQDIGNTARMRFDTSPEVAETFSSPSPENFDALEAAFKTAYGKDAKIETEADAHAAEAIHHHLRSNFEEKSELNTARKDATDFAQSKANIAARKAAKANGEDDNWVDVYRSIEGEIEKWKKGRFTNTLNNNSIILGGVPLNSMGESEQKSIIKKAVESGIKDAAYDNLYIKPRGNDGIWIFDASNDMPVVKLTLAGTNVRSQETGIGAKREALADAQKNQPPAEKKAKKGKLY